MGAVFTNVGRELTVDALLALTDPPKWVAWGTGAGDAAVTDTTLFSEGPEARVSGTISKQTTDSTGDTLRVVAEIFATAARTITNVGTFTLITAGILFIKESFTGIVLGAAGASIEFTIEANF